MTAWICSYVLLEMRLCFRTPRLLSIERRLARSESRLRANADSGGGVDMQLHAAGDAAVLLHVAAMIDRATHCAL